MIATDLRTTRILAGVENGDEFSKALGINRETLTDIERGRIGIDQETYKRIQALIKKMSPLENSTAA